MAEDLHTPGCIRTVSGLYVNVFGPRPEMFDITDIAHALSQQPRFGGHLPAFYSVAQHCVMVARLTKSLQGLLHDASEAYLLDMPSPIKAQLPGYVAAEDRLMHALAAKFGFPWPMNADVKAADKDMLEWEWHALMLGHVIFPEAIWDAPLAYMKFLDAYGELKHQAVFTSTPAARFPADDEHAGEMLKAKA